MNSVLKKATLDQVLAGELGKSPLLRVVGAINIAAGSRLRAALKAHKANEHKSAAELAEEQFINAQFGFEAPVSLTLDEACNYILLSYRKGMEIAMTRGTDDGNLKPFAWVAELKYVKTPLQVLRNAQDYGADQQLLKQRANLSMMKVDDEFRKDSLAATEKRLEAVANDAFDKDADIVNGFSHPEILECSDEDLTAALAEAVKRMHIDWKDELVKRAEAHQARLLLSMKEGKVVNPDTDLLMLITNTIEPADEADPEQIDAANNHGVPMTS